jgi:hypothetical protein
MPELSLDTLLVYPHSQSILIKVTGPHSGHFLFFFECVTHLTEQLLTIFI